MKIALIIGHTKRQPGATNYQGETEFEFNSSVCARVSMAFDSDDLRIFDKSDHYQKRVEAFNPDLIVEMHFNAFKSPAFGCEAQVLKSNTEAREHAEYLLKAFYKRFRIKNRGVKTLNTKDDRGFQNLYKFKERTALIFEPCFANFETKDSKKIIGDFNGYCDFLIEYFHKLQKEKHNVLTKMIELIQSIFQEN